MKVNYKSYIFIFWNMIEVTTTLACLVAYTSVLKVFPWYTGNSKMLFLIIIAIPLLIIITFAIITLSSSLKISRENQMLPSIQLSIIVFSYLLLEGFGFKNQVIILMIVTDIVASIAIIYKIISTTIKDVKSQF